jgi:hypothetical protein
LTVGLLFPPGRAARRIITRFEPDQHRWNVGNALANVTPTIATTLADDVLRFARRVGRAYITRSRRTESTEIRAPLMKKEVLVMLRKYELPARSRLKLIGGALEMIKSYAEPQLSKKEQGKVIDRGCRDRGRAESEAVKRKARRSEKSVGHLRLREGYSARRIRPAVAAHAFAASGLSHSPGERRNALAGFVSADIT